MVVWPVQEPVVEMVLSLSGARLKMTVLGLLKAPHTYGLASLATLPSDPGSMHETPLEMPFQWDYVRERAPIGRRCMYASTLAAPPSIRRDGMQKGLQHHTPDNCRARDGTWFGRTLGR